MNTPLDIRELVARAIKGDKNAFGLLYKEYYNRIYRYCRINMYRDQQAEDVCQEVFVRAWKALPTFTITNAGTIQAYLFRIARNLIIDISRKKKEYSLDTAGQIESETSPEDEIETKNTIVTVQAALMRLKDHDRQIIILRYFEDLSYNEIAAIIGIKEGALRVRVNRLLKQLKKIVTIHE